MRGINNALSIKIINGFGFEVYLTGALEPLNFSKLSQKNTLRNVRQLSQIVLTLRQ